MYRIPKFTLKSLAKLTEMSDDKIKMLFESLKSIKPTLNLENLEKEITEKLEIEQYEAVEINKSIFGLYLNIFYSKMSVDEFIDNVYFSLKQLGTDEFTIKEEARERLKYFIECILKLDKTVGIIGKAIGLTGDHEINFIDARILTDLRPVFSNDVSQIPENILITHNLKVIYQKKRKIEEIYINLEFEKLEDLKKLIERAINKQKTLEDMCEKININVLKREKDE